ncbi:phospholipase [Nocardia sp. alder85J]|uniref:phospholipase n=1 Tax=Nocardia sp. alder85J TaxID=2862949 RepID=UPI001CD514BF|nr:phospholipase [Nocardia sp. alder85J]MCX4093925.1 phospholipase [Nocardia sp. alder85J]
MSDITRRRRHGVLGAAAVLTMLTTTAIAPAQALAPHAGTPRTGPQTGTSETATPRTGTPLGTVLDADRSPGPAGAPRVATPRTGTSWSGALRPGGPAGTENASARAAVLNLTGAQPDSAELPDDFAVTSGYLPELRGGLLIDPTGSCSSPIPLPADFTPACQAHDLGYDLLRYAYDHGQPLGPWARQAVDSAFGHRLHAVCADHSGTVGRLCCDLMASTADTAVDLNSRRQNYATPRPEYMFGSQLSGRSLGTQVVRLSALAFAVGALAGGLGFAARSRIRRRPGARGRWSSRVGVADLAG